MPDQSEQKPTPSPSPFPSLFLNVLLPVVILNKLGSYIPGLNPWHVLVIALCFPVAGALHEWWQRKKLSALAALGALNVVGTGGLAALGLDGIWFAVKEAFFPFLIGIGVLASALTRRPFAETVFLNPAVVKIENILKRLRDTDQEAELHRLLKNATIALSASFFISAALNFGLALYVFEPIATGLSEAQRSEVLNQQVARMTWLGFAVIALPSAICMIVIFWKLIQSLRRVTGLSDSEIFAQS